MISRGVRFTMTFARLPCQSHRQFVILNSDAATKLQHIAVRSQTMNNASVEGSVEANKTAALPLGSL